MAGNAPFTFPSTGGGGSLFGAKSDASSGQSTATTSTAPTPSLFGSVTSSGGGLFGGAAKPAPSTGFTFGKPAEKKDGESQEKPAGTGLFGSAAGSATPAAAKPSFGSISTTPAGTPAASNAAQPSLFGQTAGSAPASGSSGFFNLAKPTTTSVASAGTSSTTAPSFAFPSASQTQQSSQTTPSGNTNNASNPPKTLFGAATSTTPGVGATKSLFGTQSSAVPAAGPTNSLFLPKPTGESTPSASIGQSAAPSSGLGGSTATGGFSLFSPGAKSTPAATTNTVAASTPIAGFAMGTPKTSAAAIPASLSMPAATTAPAAAATSSGGFSLFSKPAMTAAGSTSSTAPTTAATASTGPGTSTAPTTSASASHQPAASRLKNKSMDEILTRWATDLTKYQKEFQKQAEQVAEWDRILVDNTDKIGKLVTKTIQAERDAAEVEKQLSLVENQQDELAQWLDKYDKEIDDMIQKVGLTGDVAGVDVERERTFKLAEKLADRIEGCNKDLTDMIEEINTVSAMLNNTSGNDDPLSHVVRVLNSHLSQLQKIDMDATRLQAQVQEAQKQARAMGGNDWRIGTDPTEEFYKSLRR